MTRLIRLPEVIQRTGKKRSTIYQNVKNGQMPAPIKIGEKAVCWVESEIEDWIASRITASRGGKQ
jgi:prophage regulatory protein